MYVDANPLGIFLTAKSELYPTYAVTELVIRALPPDESALVVISFIVEFDESGSILFNVSVIAVPTVTPIPPPIIVPTVNVKVLAVVDVVYLDCKANYHIPNFLNTRYKPI